MIKKGFIRVKEVKGKRYAYYVVNRWYKRKGSRQKVKEYLGKVIKIGKVMDKDFLNGKDASEYAKENNKETILIDLIKHELTLLGFNLDSEIMKREYIEFDISKRQIWDISNGRKKNAVIEMNEGFMCNQTLLNLFNFKGELDKNPYYLAKTFLEAGLTIPEELFVAVYDKFF